jgi:hypothetical protein
MTFEVVRVVRVKNTVNPADRVGRMVLVSSLVEVDGCKAGIHKGAFSMQC